MSGSSLVLLLTVGVILERRRDTDLAEVGGAVTAGEIAAERPAAAPALHFVDVTATAGLGGVEQRPRQRLLAEDTSGGLAWGDVDADGWPDLFAAGLAPSAGGSGRLGRLWQNVHGAFVDRTLEGGLVAADCLGMGATWLDEDQDGRLDLFVTCEGSNRLYRNLGDWRFEDVAEEVGLADPAWSTGAAWADYDRDGDLDLYLASYVDPSAVDDGPVSADGAWEGMPFSLNPNAFDAVDNRLYRREDDGRYVDVALPSGVSNPGGRSLGVAWVDLDGDDWLDLVVNNDVSPNAIFRSLGDLGGNEVLFEDVSAAMGAADPRGSMGLCIGDLGAGRFPPDGLPDLFITHWVAQENAFYQLTQTARGLEVRDRTRVLGLGEISLEMVGWGCGITDLDLDGRLDLVVVNGSTLEQRRDQSRLRAERMFLFWNDGDRFVDLAPWSGEATTVARNARGLALADYDRDGDLDLAVATSNGGPVLLRNDAAPKAGLILTLGGTPAQRLGARAEVQIGDRRELRWIGGDASYLSGHDTPLYFALPAGTTAEVEVRWNDGSHSRASGVSGRVAIEPSAPTAD